MGLDSVRCTALNNTTTLEFPKGNRAFADLKYGEENITSPRKLIFPARKGRMYSVYIPPEVLEK